MSFLPWPSAYQLSTSNRDSQARRSLSAPTRVASTNPNVFSSLLYETCLSLRAFFYLIPYGPQFEDGISPEHQLLEREFSQRSQYEVRNCNCAHASKLRAILLSAFPAVMESRQLTTNLP